MVQFPEETHAVEGETVPYQVKVRGSPQPKLMWYHNGEEVGADYSRKLEEDGTPAMPATEARHNVTYQNMAQNSAGRRKGEVRLIVEAEDTQQRPATTKPAMELSAVPVAMFGSHVEQQHTRNNQVFRDEYEVC